MKREELEGMRFSDLLSLAEERLAEIGLIQVQVLINDAGSGIYSLVFTDEGPDRCGWALYVDLAESSEPELLPVSDAPPDIQWAAVDHLPFLEEVLRRAAEAQRVRRMTAEAKLREWLAPKIEEEDPVPEEPQASTPEEPFRYCVNPGCRTPLTHIGTCPYDCDQDAHE